MTEDSEQVPVVIRGVCSAVFGVGGGVAAYYILDPVSWLAVVGCTIVGAVAGWWAGPSALDMLFATVS